MSRVILKKQMASSSQSSQNISNLTFSLRIKGQPLKNFLNIIKTLVGTVTIFVSQDGLKFSFQDDEKCTINIMEIMANHLSGTFFFDSSEGSTFTCSCDSGSFSHRLKNINKSDEIFLYHQKGEMRLTISDQNENNLYVMIHPTADISDYFFDVDEKCLKTAIEAKKLSEIFKKASTNKAKVLSFSIYESGIRARSFDSNKDLLCETSINYWMNPQKVQRDFTHPCGEMEDFGNLQFKVNLAVEFYKSFDKLSSLCSKESLSKIYVISGKSGEQNRNILLFNVPVGNYGSYKIFLIKSSEVKTPDEPDSLES